MGKPEILKIKESIGVALKLCDKAESRYENGLMSDLIDWISVEMRNVEEIAEHSKDQTNRFFEDIGFNKTVENIMNLGIR